MASIKVLNVVSNLGIGGNQRMGVNFAHAYQKLNYNSIILATIQGGEREAALKNLGITTLIGKDNDPYVDAVDQAINFQPDFIHLHGKHVDSEIIERIKSELNYFCPVFEKNTFSLPSPRYKVIDCNIHMAYWCMWNYIHYCKAKHIKDYKPNLIIQNIVDQETYYPAPSYEVEKFRKKYNIPSDAILLGRIGQPIDSKWSKNLIYSFKKISERNPNTYLLLIGAPNTILKRAEKLPTSIRNKIVQITSIVSDDELRNAYSSMDLFLHSARIGESFGIVLVESMLCGTPAITLNTPFKDNSQSEVVSHAEGGIVINDPSKYWQAVHELLNDKKKLKQLKESCLVRGRKKYSIESVLPKLKLLGETVKKTHDYDNFIKLTSELSYAKAFDIDMSEDIIKILENAYDRPGLLSPVFIKYRSFINKLLIHNKGWNFLYRNYLSISEFRS